MYGFKYNLGLRVLKGSLFLAVIAIFAVFCFFGIGFNSDYTISVTNLTALSVIFAVLFYFFSRTYDSFVVSERRVTEMFFSQTLSIMFTDGILYVVSCIIRNGIINLLFPLLCFLCQEFFAACWCVIANKLYFKLFPPKASIAVYDMRRDFETLVKDNGLSNKYDIKDSMQDVDCIKNIDVLKNYKTVFISGVHSHNRNIILKYCVANGIEVIMIPKIGDILMSGAKETHMFHLSVLKVRRYCPDPVYLIIKRIFDIVVSVIGLIVLSPLFLITSILIKKCDGGPVFYKQKRLTKDGKEFYIHKFRSMRVDAEKDGVARLSSGENDDRITPIGKVLRKFRMDELPQLIDILVGNLSVVGPRPERPEISSEYEKTLPEFRLRLQAKAGLTGYAQVYGQYNTDPYDKLQMDLMYINHCNLLMDLRICFATFKILFEKESTDGVAEGQITALSYTENDEKEPVTSDN